MCYNHLGDYMNLRNELFKNQDLKYKAFHSKLVPDIDESTIIGVRTPVLRSLAKEKFDENLCEYYEEKMIYGFSLGNKKCSVEEHIDDLKAFVPMIDNWAICDMCCSSFKFTKKFQSQMLGFITSYLDKSEYEKRFAIVMLMYYYLTDDFIDYALDIFKSTQGEYYVNMAVAWALSTSFVKYQEKTLEIIKSKALPPDIQNKTIQKIKDSLRVPKATKDSLNQYKIK